MSLGQILKKMNRQAFGNSEARRFAKAERESLNLRPWETKDLIKNRTVDHYLDGEIEQTEALAREALKRYGIL